MAATKKRQWPSDGVAKTNEAADFLKVSRATIYRMIDEGLLPVVPVGTGKTAKRLSWEMLHRYASGKPVVQSGDANQ